jgi:hypothetical protein
MALSTQFHVEVEEFQRSHTVTKESDEFSARGGPDAVWSLRRVPKPEMWAENYLRNKFPQKRRRLPMGKDGEPKASRI